MTTSSSTTVSNSNVGLASIIHVPQPHIPQGTHPQPHKRRSAQPTSPQNHPSRHSQPQHSQLRTDSSVDVGEHHMPATVDIRDEMVERFRRYYQRFVGYPAADFQLPANTSVRYSLLQHTGIHFWETPTFKASVAGFGGVMTTVSVGFLLSDHAPDVLKAAPLSYTVPSPSVSMLDAKDQADPIALDTHHQTLSDRPETIPNLEFSQTVEATGNVDSHLNEADGFSIEEAPVISLESLSARRFEVQRRAEAPTQPSERNEAETAATELPESSPRAIATEPLQPRAIASQSPPSTESMTTEMPVGTSQQLSEEDVANISERFATPLTPESTRTNEAMRSSNERSTQSNSRVSQPPSESPSMVDSVFVAPTTPAPIRSQTVEAPEPIEERPEHDLATFAKE